MLITEKFVRKIIKKALLLKEDIKEKQSKAKEEIETINSLLSVLAKDHKNKMSNAAKEIGEPFSNGGKGVEYEAQNNFNQALASARLLGMRNEEIKSDANYKKLITALKKFAEELKTPTPDKGKGAGKFPQKKKKGSNPKIKEIQEKINKLGMITDYQEKKLNADGKWGPRTRSAVSKLLNLIHSFAKDDTEYINSLGLKAVEDNDPLFEKLATKRKGPGSWKALVLKLTGKKDKYDAVIAILDKIAEKKIGNDANVESDLKKGYLEQLKKYGSRNNYLYLVDNATASSNRANQTKGFRLDFISSSRITNDRAAGGTSVNDKRRKYKNLEAANAARLLGGGLVSNNKLTRDAKIILSPTDDKSSVTIDGVEIDLEVFDVVVDGTLDDNIFIGNYVALPYLPKKFGTDLGKFDGGGVTYYVQVKEYERRAKKAAENFAKRKPTNKNT